jgi:uridine kinase
VLLIDGRSGSGKTDLAAAIIEGSSEIQLVRLDDLYPGWDGLAEGSASVARMLVEHRWRSWDWAADAPDGWHTIDPHRPLVVEGMGSISARSRSIADFAIWVELDAAKRKSRALERDGDAYAPHWSRWAAQEEAYLEREHPRFMADEVIDGADAVGHAARWRRTMLAASMKS